jgi:outer membrane protein TolC
MMQYRTPLLLAVLLSVLLAMGACSTGRLPADAGENTWKTGGLLAERRAAASRAQAVHATQAQPDSMQAEETAPAGAHAESVGAPPEDAVLSFDDCVFMAVQSAPDLVDSVIDLELAESAADSAYWRRAPSLSARFRVTANLTKQYKEYSDTSARMDFGIYGFEPVVSYFSHKAALLLQDIALLTHQKAVEKRGEQIAAALLKLESLERVGERRAAEASLARQLTSFQRTRQATPLDRLAAASALHQEKAAQAALEKNRAQIASTLLSLKLMLGCDPDRRLKVRGASVAELLQGDKAALTLADKRWEDVWPQSPDARIARISLKLRDYDVMMAWARYLPSITMEVQPANPTSDYATYSSKDDIFTRLYFTLPLLDWGERSRGVDRARLQKARASLRGKLGRLHFMQEWREQLLGVTMAEADHELAGERVSVARLEEEKAGLQYKSGAIAFDALVNAGRATIRDEIALEEAALQLRLREFSAWMLGGGFRRRFFEPHPDALEE